ncbi:hypothetical protein GW17_00004009 [Ensete ventricosum]|nr:hypothetical protein GW17_00004009 [Ensete ventricosum]
MLLKSVTLLAIKPSEEWTTRAIDGSIELLDSCKVLDAIEELCLTIAAHK